MLNKGIITPEMEYIAIRENYQIAKLVLKGLLNQHEGQSFGAAIPKEITPNLFVKKWL